jgi:hypothetical protein
MLSIRPIPLLFSHQKLPLNQEVVKGLQIANPEQEGVDFVCDRAAMLARWGFRLSR